jgi:hypothetical protein
LLSATSGFPAGHASNGVGRPILSVDDLLASILSTRNDDELDDVVHQLKPSQLNAAVKQVEISTKSFLLSLMRRQNKLECLALKILSSQVLKFEGNA